MYPMYECMYVHWTKKRMKKNEKMKKKKNKTWRGHDVIYYYGSFRKVHKKKIYDFTNVRESNWIGMLKIFNKLLYIYICIYVYAYMYICIHVYVWMYGYIERRWIIEKKGKGKRERRKKEYVEDGSSKTARYIISSYQKVFLLFCYKITINL